MWLMCRLSPGEGVFGTVVCDGKETHAFIGGVESAFRRAALSGKEELAAAAEAQAQGKVVAALSIENHGVYLFVLTDTIRPQSHRAVHDLHALGKHVVMLTGDHEESANRIGRSLAIDEVCADLVPERKVEIVAALSQDKGVLMVGDGINDAPALGRATVGVSMGQLSSAAARDASDVVLLNNDLDLIGWLFGKASHTRRVVIQNLVLAFGAILLGTVSSLVVGIPLWMAVTIHEGSTLIVGLNALRLTSIKAWTKVSENSAPFRSG